MPQVSGTADAEGLGFRRQQFVGAAVAEGAIGRAFVAALAGLAVDALVVVAGLVGVAGDAGRFGDIRGVRDLVVRLVAGIAGERRVRALRELLPLLVAGGASGGGVVPGGVKRSAGDAGETGLRATNRASGPRRRMPGSSCGLHSHGGSSDELPVHVGGSHQKAEKDGDHRQDLAPLVDHDRVSGRRTSVAREHRCMTCRVSSSLPATIFRQMNRASITMAVTRIQRATNGRKLKFIVDLQIRVHSRICGPWEPTEPAVTAECWSCRMSCRWPLRWHPPPAEDRHRAQHCTWRRVSQEPSPA